MLAATQRPRAEALLREGEAGADGAGGAGGAGAAGGAGGGGGGAAAAADDDERRATRAEAEQLDTRVAALPEAIRVALNFGGPLPIAPVPGEPVLGEAVAPIATLDELAEAISHHVAEPWYVRDERIMDAVLRRCDQPFPAPLEPYTPMLRRLQRAGLRRRGPPCRRGVADEEAGDARERHGDRAGIIAACARAARGDAAPLLALPSHAGGWIAPHLLVERVRAVGETADEVELAQALLRLAPEGRDPDSAHELPGRPGAIVRCALGGPEVPDDGAAALAARAVRVPLLTAVSVTVDDVEVTRTPAGPLEGPVGEYLVTVTGEKERHGRFATEPLAWPLRRDLQCAGVFWHVRFALGPGAPQFAAASAYLELLTREGEPLAPLSLRLALQALCSSAESDHLTAAVDLLIAAIEDGRVDAPALVPHCARTCRACSPTGSGRA